MRSLLERRHILGQNWGTILGGALCLYFAYHLIQGERSYLRLLGLHQAMARAESTLESTQIEREKLERRVEMLRPGSLSRDFLEERARTVLGFRAAGDQDVLLTPPSR